MKKILIAGVLLSLTPSLFAVEMNQHCPTQIQWVRDSGNPNQWDLMSADPTVVAEFIGNTSTSNTPPSLDQLTLDQVMIPVQAPDNEFPWPHMMGATCQYHSQGMNHIVMEQLKFTWFGTVTTSDGFQKEGERQICTAGAGYCDWHLSTHKLPI